MKIAILGAGMVGFCYMQAFLEQGHQLVGICDPQLRDEVKQQLTTAGGEVHSQPGEWLQQADLVVSAVFGTVALGLAKAAFSHMKKDALYIDMTTADPEDMHGAAAAASEHGIHFVDVAITGAVNLSLQKTPLLIAGEKANEVFELYRPFGARLTIVGARPGDAAALKLLRSIYTKGVEALAVECLVTAHRMGLTEELFDVLKDIDETPLRKLLDSMVVTHIPHSARRRNEVVEAQRQMKNLDIQPVVTQGVEQLFSLTAAAHARLGFDGKAAHEALEWLSKNVMNDNK